MVNVIALFIFGVFISLMGYGSSYCFTIAMETSKWWIGFPLIIASLMLGFAFLFSIAMAIFAFIEELK